MECSSCESVVSTAPATPDITEMQHLRNENGCISISKDDSTSVYSENRFLEDFDTYWDELGDRLSISQAVHDSIMREMVKAVCEEAKDKIASKEREISLLNSKLNKYRNTNTNVKLPNFAVINDEITSAVSRLRQGLMDAGLDLSYRAQFERFRVSLEEKIQDLSGEVEEEKIYAFTSVLNSSFEQINRIFVVLKAIISENEWEHELQKEVSSTIYRSYFECFYEEFELRLQEKLGAWRSVLLEFNTLREELKLISKSLTESDATSSALKVKDHDIASAAGTDKTLTENEMATLEVHLEHMSKEETIDYFKCEITKMRRQHETAMHEKTEQLFKLKRELLNVKNSSPLRKDKDFEFVKQRLPEVIAKLDEVMLKEVQLRVDCTDKVEEIRRLEDRIDQLLHHNNKLKDLLEDTRKPQSLLDDGVLDEVAKLSAETDALKLRIDCLLGENRNLTDLLENTRKAQSLSEKELVGKIKSLTAESEDMKVLREVETMVTHTFLAETFNESICKFEDQKNQMNTKKTQEVKELNEIISVYLGESEKFTMEINSRLAIQSRKIKLISCDIETLREKLKAYSDSKGETELTRSRLHETLSQYERDLEKQRDLIDRTRIENHKLSSLFDRKEKEVKMVSDFISEFMEKLLGKFTEFENRLLQSIKKSDDRLRTLVGECSTLSQQLIQSRRNEILSKQILEIRTSNLAKAEAEVDLLGDEVDALLSLLGKIYIALDHYSPVFVHYPGVMEILKLIKRELQGEI